MCGVVTDRPITEQACVKIHNLWVDYTFRRALPIQRRSTTAQILGIPATLRRGPVVKVRALQHIDLSLRAGERVGVIGRNGAGKSTLLKAIGGVVRPAEGLVEIVGQVQALFDLGVGLEMDASGRENILFRGLLQGLSPKEVSEREAEIVEFADLGPFIDMPVSSYSSGMVVRLAFSVATFLEGDILLVDEIFAAGDHAFQQRAQRRMEMMISAAGLFVFTSHNLSLVSELCSRGIFLDKGRIVFDGPVDDAITAYLEHVGHSFVAAGA